MYKELLLEKIEKRDAVVGIIGLGYVGLPLAMEFANAGFRVIGYDISQRCRKRIEEVFGWIKSSAGLAKVKLRGRERVDAAFTLALAAYNLIRLPKLLAVPI